MTDVVVINLAKYPEQQIQFQNIMRGVWFIFAGELLLKLDHETALNVEKQVVVNAYNPDAIIALPDRVNITFKP